jgi:hypothetical protein
MKSTGIILFLSFIFSLIACTKHNTSAPFEPRHADTTGTSSDSTITVSDSAKIKKDTVRYHHHSVADGYPYIDTFYGSWHDVSSGDYPPGDTTFNTFFYVKHISSDSVAVTGNMAFISYKFFAGISLTSPFHFHGYDSYTFYPYDKDDVVDRYIFSGDNLTYSRDVDICAKLENGSFHGSLYW